MTDDDRIDVLVAEDDPNDWMLTERGLLRHDPRLRIRQAHDGVEVLELLERQGQKTAPVPAPRLVLLDIKMPRIGGIDVLVRLRGIEGLRELPVVMLTSSEAPRDREQCEAAGASGYFVKPLEFEAYLAAVQQLARRWLGDGPA